jgi:NAD(P)-dependent dehydrogenase (short-subunit alcohol dehydrogenase family)
MGILDGKVVIITGAGRGLGRAYALEFAKHGAKLVINDRGTEPNGIGHDAAVAAAVASEVGLDIALANDDDVSTRAGVDALMAAALARFGQVDVLVHNAGFVRDAAILDLDDETWTASINGLLTSTYMMVQAVAKHLISRNAPGQILATTSLIGIHGGAGLPTYAAAKAGIIGYCKSASMELKPHGIAVNVLSPLAYTRLTAPMFADVPNAADLLKPESIADVAVYLASPLASNITGTVVDVQGPRVALIRSTQAEGVVASRGPRWTPEELHERWSEF